MQSNSEHKGRILIADDDDAFRTMVRLLLEEEGYNVAEVADGDAAVEEGRRRDFDLVLLDIKMPRMDGIQALRALKPLCPSTEFLMITGLQDVQLAVESMKLGAREYLSKPIAPNDLLGRVSSTLRAHFAEVRLHTLQSEFTSRLLYEIRTPLTSLDTTLAFLLRTTDDPLSERQREAIVLASNDVERMLKLLNDMIDLTKIESGHLALERLPTNLDELVPMICRHLEPRIRSKKITLSVNIGAGIPTMSIDPEKIEQVVINLMDNAVKYTDENGTLGVSVTLTQHDLGGSPTECVEIAISDSGIGIGADELPYLFDKYKEFITGRTSNQKSTGLGLAICKNIVEAHHGVLEAESHPGKGTIFRIFLPVDSY